MSKVLMKRQTAALNPKRDFVPIFEPIIIGGSLTIYRKGQKAGVRGIEIDDLRIIDQEAVKKEEEGTTGIDNGLLDLPTSDPSQQGVHLNGD